ncbi:autotransporter phospholipase A1 FplA [Fusobacterium pseudoperiodonticum]|uniref:Serine protease n=1 Tax=Fusobacterium pseudoperiodonticum TaxID=2663009 RepID=A0AAD0AKK7_9FUSO|nr:autotransporter phospholipase A1 FplA [Fusobacterium pseudoperiodonticum]ATV36030.1 serine protease [Fusobacterium pseudoperiodonticum]ATV61066.1 serine protease [Fusobacterium pseudoperiodonticum]
MKKIIFLAYIFLIFNFAYTEEIQLKTKEDVEIEKMEEQIKNLQNKIENTKKLKSAKENKNLKVALVLSGGGVKGYAHLGVLRVLEKENIKIDYITGTSIGAFIGTMYSIGYSVDEIEKLLDDLNIGNFLENVTDNTNLSLDKKESLKKYSVHLSFDNELNFSFPKGLKGTGEEYLILKKLLGKYEYMDNFDNFPIPLRIVATNLNTGETKAFSRGDVAKVLIASMSIPSIFEPMKIDGEIYVDGLVTRNLPVEEAYEMGADIVIASDIGAPVIEKDDYNILSVLSQANTIQASNVTKISREKASILISPDVKDISALDSSKKEELMKLGKVAAEKELDKIKLLSKADNKKKKENFISDNDVKITINKIEYDEKFSDNTIVVLNDIFKDLLNKPISKKDIDKKIIDIYSSKYMDKVYYTIDGNTLIIDGEKPHSNKIGLGFNYLTGYGTTFNIGSDLVFNGKFNNNINFNFKFGDYLGADLATLSYYGVKNRFGFLTNIGYDENPFFLYDNKRKSAKFISREAYFKLGLFTQPTNSTMLSYGILSKFSSLKQDTGGNETKSLEYSENSTKTYLSYKYNSLDSITNPMKGVKADFVYNFSSSFGKSKSNLYGPTFTLKGYVPVNPRFSLMYGLNYSSLRGDNIRADRRIKLGGMYTNIDNNDFEFYGYNYQEKQMKDLINLTLGFKHKIVYSLYFNTKFNIATFNEDNPMQRYNSRMWKDYSQGLGFSLTYDSPIGPIEFSVSSDLQNIKPIGSISIGYKFD